MPIPISPSEAPETAALHGSESDFPSRKSATDSWAFRHRGLLGGVCLIPAALAAILWPSVIPEASPIAWLLDVLGWTLFLGYASMRIWATLYIGGVKDVRLQTSGPYSITRNPLYLGGLCLALSGACFLKSVFVIALTFIAAGIYLRWVIPAEEKVLERIFGQAFVEYKSRTPRLLPRPSLYQSAPTIELKVRALRTEAQRLWTASLVPFLGLHAAQIHDALAHFHWFHLH